METHVDGGCQKLRSRSVISASGGGALVASLTLECGLRHGGKRERPCSHHFTWNRAPNCTAQPPTHSLAVAVMECIHFNKRGFLVPFPTVNKKPAIAVQRHVSAKGLTPGNLAWRKEMKLDCAWFPCITKGTRLVRGGAGHVVTDSVGRDRSCTRVVQVI